MTHSTGSGQADLPAPLVPADVDLRGNDWMPLFGERLFTSETWIEATYEGRSAALRLWWQAFAKEKPAASLPDSDRLLAVYAGYGEVVKAWKKIKAEAMRGFVLCSDGRWYHPVVAEIAMDAWHRGQDKNEANEAKKERQRRWRERLKALTSALRERGITPPPGASLETLEQLARDAAVDVSGASREIGNTRQDTTLHDTTPQEEVEGAGAPTPPEPDDDLALPPALDRRPEAEAVRLWNEAAERTGLPAVMRVTDPRRKALKARLAEAGGLDGWKAALAKLEASSFLTGRTGRTNGHENWRCDLDFILRQAKFTKLMEGGFDDPPDSRHAPKSGIGAAIAAVAELGRTGAG